MEKKMNSNIRAFIVPFLFILLITLPMCNDSSSDINPYCNEPNGGNPLGRIINTTGCKNDSSARSGEIKSTDECIEFKFYEDYNLARLTHINAGFNCCPGKITAVIIGQKDSIFIYEEQAEAGCRCECLYDIDYELSKVEKKVYHIEIYGPITDGDAHPPLSFDVDFSDSLNNCFCIERGFYPWVE
jgi:hypothetical protein